ncbi:hypothetical protein ACI3ET_01830 [Ornithinimicrobium sp. LYQ121]|uniref:hypothetical protein n=1 Tax=Ornithinimicrobium sp. LYQ121 TaxID=3378801 RepID=UPI0038528F09
MENTEWGPDRAAAALREAEADRMALAGRIGPSRRFLVALGLVIAVHIGVVATGFARQQLWIIGVGLAIFVVGAAVQLWVVRRLSGVWVAGFARHVVLGTGALASGTYVVALGAATWAAFAEQWWLVAAAAVAGGAAYSVAGRSWLSRQRRDPDRSWSAEPMAVQATMVVVALAGLAVLVLVS